MVTTILIQRNLFEGFDAPNPAPIILGTLSPIKSGIYDLLSEQQMTRHEMAERLKVLPWSITRPVNELIEAGLVVRTGTKRLSKFRGSCEVLSLAKTPKPDVIDFW